MSLENELIQLGLEVGGEISRLASESLAKVNNPSDKRRFLKEKTKGLIVQNPHSGFGLGRSFERKLRFFDVSLENFWREPKLK